jgi:hypothetical protein
MDLGKVATSDDTEATASPGRRGLALVLGALLLAFAFVALLAGNEPAPERHRFDKAPRVAMRRKKPDYVLIGNSMVKTRFDERALDRSLRPRRALIVANDSSRSAMWYAMFKNYVVASGQRPRRVLFFFRDVELTAPTAGTQGDGRWRLERVSLADEPLIEAHLSPRWTDPVERLRHELAQRVPLTRLREHASPHIDRFALWVASKVASTEDVKLADINEAFALGNLRPAPRVDEVPELPSRRLDDSFAGLVDDSFLPDIIALASEHAIPIAFVRVRTRAAANGAPESEKFAAYQRELRAYLEQRSIPLYDLSGQTWEDVSFYAQGDHVKFGRRREYTRLFVQHMGHVFD